MLTPPTSRRSLLVYPGGKSWAVRTLLRFVPAGTRAVVSPFFGGGSVEFALAAAGMRVAGGDIDRPLVNFWSVALSDAAGLAVLIERLLEAGITAPVFRALREAYPRFAAESGALAAAAYYCINRMSYGGTTWFGGFGPKSAPRSLSRSLRHRVAEFRAPNVEVRLADYRETLDRYPDRFAVVDPPYLDVELNRSLYGEERQEIDHEELTALLRRRSTGFFLTCTDGPAIRALYRGCRFTPAKWNWGIGAAKRSNEVVVSAC